MSYDVFISHSSRDKPVADGVCAALESVGIRCWIAPRDLIAGRPFSGEIIRGIKSCRVMVLLFSSASNASPEVLREVQLATTHRLHLVNFRIEQAGVSDDLAYFLGVPHWLDALTQPMREHHSRLIESVKALLALGAPAPGPAVVGEEAGADHDSAAAGVQGEPERAASAVGRSGMRWGPAFAAALLLVAAATALLMWKRERAPASNPSVAQVLPAERTQIAAPKEPAPEVKNSLVEKETRPAVKDQAGKLEMPQGGLVITGPVTLLGESKLPPEEKEPEIEAAVEPPDTMKHADAKAPWENSLGMKFVRVPIKGGPTDGQMVWFSVYETRMQDYAAFWAENPKRNARWKLFDMGGPQVPVASIDWPDARAFCTWLSAKERAAGTLPAGLRYRLPSDHEWSCAVGLSEDASLPPMEKHQANAVDFPWGKTWPPPEQVGNYSTTPGSKPDPFMMLAPAGSFPPNVLGLYDLGGNVAEWCADRDKPDSVYHVTRGGAFFLAHAG